MIVEKVLVESVQLTNAAVVYYTTSIKVLTVIRRATVCNTTAGAVTVTIYITLPGASPAAGNTVIYQQSIPAGKTVDLYQLVNHVLTTAGTSIQALASANTSLTFRVSGYERPVI